MGSTEIPSMRAPGIRTFRLIQYVTGYIEGVSTVDDLPSRMQDQVAEALERLADKYQLPLAIVRVVCDKDIDSKDPTRQFFVEVIASEVIAMAKGNMN